MKCDKRHPCSNCNKAAIECIFPGPGRAPRRSRKPPDTELLARLRRLEGVVQTLGKGVDEEPELEPEPTPPAPAGQTDPTFPKPDEPHGPETKCGKMISMHEPSKAEKKQNGEAMTKEFGRLVVDEGRSRYVSNKFWTTLSEEVSELQDILDDPTEDEDDHPSPQSTDYSSTPSHGFLFSFSSLILSLRTFHPPTNQIATYWNLYKTNVSPVMKLLHDPQTELVIAQASQTLDNVSKPVEALLFAIYFAVITSMNADDCSAVLGVDRVATLQKYRFATEQAFARANFLTTSDIMVLQAMLIFLIAVRRTDDSRYVWTVTGLLIRLATSLGLHRDGVQFGVSPFDTEIRRRFWWHLCILDTRAAEDQGCEPSISDANFDTKFPLNINDEDISPSTTVTPEEHEGATEMTFDLIRYSVSTTVRRLSYSPPGKTPCKAKMDSITLQHKEHIIEELHQYVERKFLCHLDTNIPLHWVAATIARLILAKMWLVVHHPLQRSDSGGSPSEETKDRLFTTSVEVIEFSQLLETERATSRWGWLFRTYVQWHAIAFVLSQLCLRTEGPTVEKAWMAIDSTFETWAGQMTNNQRGMMWKPLRKLLSRARSARSKAMQQRALFPLDGRLGPALTTPLITQPGPMMNGSSAGDYFEVPDTSMSPDSLDVSNGNPSLPDPALQDLMGNVPDVYDYFDTRDFTLFANQNSQGTSQSISQPAQQQAQIQVDGINGINGTASSIDQNGGVNGSNVDPWQYVDLQGMSGNGAPSGNGVVSSAGMTNGGLQADAMMTSELGDNWDDMVREFQMDRAGMAWAGVDM